MNKFKLGVFSHRKDPSDGDWRYVPDYESYTLSLVRAFLNIGDMKIDLIEDKQNLKTDYVLCVPDDDASLKILPLIHKWPLQLRLGDEERHVLVELTPYED